MYSPCHGLLVLDKPGGMTSRDVVDRVQRWFPPRTRIGHTGTLDPLASGVLVICVGGATRLTEYVQQLDKVYEVRMLLGGRSDTDDADGQIEVSIQVAPPDRAALADCLQSFTGDIEQVPPVYSAAKVAGRRAYDLARRGREVDLQPRRVRVYAIDLLAYEYPRLDLRVRSGKGMYIRSLARDLGDRLGCGAYVETLRRTRVGPFEVSRAISIEADAAIARNSLLPPEAAVTDLPHLQLADAALMRLRQGQAVPGAEGQASQALSAPSTTEVAVFDPVGKLAAIAVPTVDGLLVPAKVFNWE